MTQYLSAQKNKISKKEKFLNILLVLAIFLCIVAITLRIFVFSKIQVKQTSMYPTYQEGETFWISKVKPISRGCVAVFYKYNVDGSIFDGFISSESELLVKRIVAVAGDKIWVEQVGEIVETDDDQQPQDIQYTLYIWCFDTQQVIEETYYDRNGQPVVIPNIVPEMLGNLSNHIGQQNAYTVPENCFYALGDNRNISQDSRNLLGSINISRLLGVALG